MFGIASKLSRKLSSDCATGMLSKVSFVAQKPRVFQNVICRGMATQKRPCMEDYFKNKCFIVTGSSQGIGKVITERLLSMDVNLFAVDKDLSKLSINNPKMTKVEIDISDWNQAYCEILKLGPVHGLVNNAGVAFIEPFLETSQHGWDSTLNVNSRGMVRVSQAVAKNMIKEKIKGSIVNVSSTISERAIPDHVAYCASKGAVNQITRTMAIELGPFGIRTNNVNPTVVLTEMGKKAWSDPKKSQPIMDRIPLGRFADAEDIANGVIFLLSDYSTMCNGLNLYIDGGFMTR